MSLITGLDRINADIIRFGSKSDTVRDALTGVGAGDTIFNATSSKLNTHNGTSWDTTIAGALTNTTFTQQMNLKGTSSLDSFGDNCAMSGDGTTMIVGQNTYNTNIGAIWVFVRSGSTWTEQAGPILPTGYTGSPRFGSSVAINYDGNSIAVGGRTNTGGGAVFILTRSGATWSQQAILTGSVVSASANYGLSVAMSATGDIVAVGAPQDSSVSAIRGAVFVYTRSGVTWTEKVKFVTSDSAALSRVGDTVCMSADGATITAGGSQDGGNVGAIWTFTQSGSTWVQAGSKLVPNDAVGSTLIAAKGLSLSHDGRILAFTSSVDNTNVGALWIYERNNEYDGSFWNKKQKIAGIGATAVNNNYGNAVAVVAGGTSIIVAAYQLQNPSTLFQGGYFTYTRSGSVYSLTSTTYASGTSGSPVSFAFAISTSRDGKYLGLTVRTDNIVGNARVFYTPVARDTLDLSTSPLIAVRGLVVDNLRVSGVAKTQPDGLITSSLITNFDVDQNAAIIDTKLATISTAGKVSNSATTATNANTVSTIVARDASGNFSAGIITSTSINAVNTTNQIVLGTTNTTTISATAPVAPRLLTIPDSGADANFVMTAGVQAISGVKTLSNGVIIGSSAGSSVAGNITYLSSETFSSKLRIHNGTSQQAVVAGDFTGNTITINDVIKPTNLVLTDSSSTTEGALRYNSTSHLPEIYRGTAWIPIVSRKYGTGIDGDVTINSNTTLVRDMYYMNLTVNATFTLNTGGFRIFVEGLLTLNGTIARNGNAGVGATAGVTLAAGTLGAPAAGGGGVAGAAGTAGPQVTANTQMGGVGGAGGVGGGGLAGGVVRANPSNPPAVNGGLQVFNDSECVTRGRDLANTQLRGGDGGGGGGGNATGAASGGGGGSGAGVIVIVAAAIIGTGIITAIGGNGGNSGTGAGGGGGGGGGCIAVLVESTVARFATSAGGGYSVAGGAGGPGNGAGANGNVGGTGNIFIGY